MKIAIIGFGVQGKKRIRFLKKKNIFCIVDSFKKKDFKDISQVPLKKYDTAFVCAPDKEKLKIIDYCIKNKKNILVEKPFRLKNSKKYHTLKKFAIKNNVIFYTAYNHRFEPGIIKIKEIIKKKKIGTPYNCRIFYGNGTSLLVKKSKWRDVKPGVISDLGSHLVDICMFIFGNKLTKLKLSEANKFENNAYDHAMVNLFYNKIPIQLEMTLCSWENTFCIDIFGSKGSVHMNSLCKWSDSEVILKKRKFPSGKPSIKKFIFKKGDPTWKKEHNYFFKLNKSKKKSISIEKDFLINKYLNELI